jgi:uncharacterized membrane protein
MASVPPPDTQRAAEPQAPLATRYGVAEVGLARPLAWLRLGWADLVAAPVPGLVHGLAAAAYGWVLLAWAHEMFWALAGAFSGFLIVAPIIATGLYEISRVLERGGRPLLADAFAIWRGHEPRLVHFGVLLAFAGTGWVLTSASLVTGYVEQPVHRPLDFLHYVVLRDSSWVFEIWLVMGALLAAPMFASSVVAIPLLLERKEASVLQAVLTSWRAVLASPATLALWAALILALTLVGMATLLLGLVVIVPWLAHASWHAYRDIVVPEPGGATASDTTASEPR